MSDWIYLNWSCFFWILSSLRLSRLPFVRATASVSVLHQYSLISLHVTQTFPIHFLCATLSHCLILLFVSWWLMLRIINMVHNTPRDVLFFSSMLLMWPQVWGKGGYLLLNWPKDFSLSPGRLFSFALLCHVHRETPLGTSLLCIYMIEEEVVFCMEVRHVVFLVFFSSPCL